MKFLNDILGNNTDSEYKIELLVRRKKTLPGGTIPNFQNTRRNCRNRSK